jgi:hypothetical protein
MIEQAAGFARGGKTLVHIGHLLQYNTYAHTRVAFNSINY